MATTLPYKYDLTMYRGDSFRRTITLKQGGVAINLAGCTIKAQVRRSSAINAAIVFSFDIENIAPTLGKFDIVAEPSVTTGLSIQLCPYDLEVTSADGTVTTWLAGNVSVVADVSRT